MGKNPPAVAAREYAALAGFRYALRQFLHFSAEAAAAAGLSVAQHQALLAIKGWAPGPALSVGDLAERLDRRSHSTVGLVNRLVRLGLVRRASDPTDRRRVWIQLTAGGERRLARLSAAHRDELRRLGPELRRLLRQLA